MAIIYASRRALRALLSMRQSEASRWRGTLREQDGREPFAAIDCRFIGRAPGLEELNELLAPAVVVPFTVALDDLDEVIDRLLAAAMTGEREREIEPCLVIERIGGDFLLQIGNRADG